jgi:CheY-like chemotaxis protein
MKEIKILFVDDERLNCKYFKRIMGKKFSVDTLEHISEALEVLNKSHNYDFVISDYKFENDNLNRTGLELLDSISLGNTQKMICTAFESLKESDLKYKVIYKPLDYKLLASDIIKLCA